MYECVGQNNITFFIFVPLKIVRNSLTQLPSEVIQKCFDRTVLITTVATASERQRAQSV